MSEDKADITLKETQGETLSRNFIQREIDRDLEEGVYDHVMTRFPPEPNGYLHIGHAKSIILNSGIAAEYGGQFNLRFDDTNPVKEDTEYVNSIIEDVRWLGADFRDEVLYASDYFGVMYEKAELLIKKGLAYVSDLSADEIKATRGDFNTPGEEDPGRNRSIEENLEMFRAMRSGVYADGEKVLRARIDMAAGNINMRDPVLYRVLHATHHNTGDSWCIYPMYDYAHPIEDAVEGITHSLCTLEFESHRPLYDWVVQNTDWEMPPRQIEFAKMFLTNVITGKRYIKKLVDQHIVDGWDDPRLVTIAALRRRGYTPESIRKFVELTGISKADSSCDMELLEYCIRDDLKLKRPRMLAVLRPLKLIIDNYEGDGEWVDMPNNLEVPGMGTRSVRFGRELYIEQDDFMEEPPHKYYRLYPGNEVRLMGAYFVRCVGCDKDEDGRVLAVHATYDPSQKSGQETRKVKSTIHWVHAVDSFRATVRLYESLVDPDKDKVAEDGSVNINPHSLTVLKDARLEPSLRDALPYESFQFVRNGYFNVDARDSRPGAPVFNRIVKLKSSFKIPK